MAEDTPTIANTALGTSSTGVQQYYDNATGELSFGIGTSAQTATVGGRTVVIQSATVSEEGDVKKYRNNIGQTCSIVVPEQMQQVSIEGLLVKSSGSSTPPKKGDTVSLPSGIDGVETSGKTFRLDSFSVAESNEDVAKVSMTVTGYAF